MDQYQKFIRNNGDNTFTEQTSISLTGVGDSSEPGGIMIMMVIWIFF